MKMNKVSINVAIIGVGYMGQNHARVFSGIENVNVVALCDQNKQTVNKLAKQYRIKQYLDFRELFSQETLDAVSICLPTSLHAQVAQLALEKGIHVFIEKPISATVAEAQKLIRISASKKAKIMVGHIERFNPVVNEIKQRILSGELGKILKVHTQRFSPPTGRAQDVSAVIDLATHDIDIIQYLLGEKLVRMYSEIDNRAHKKEDLMSALIRFKNGSIGLIEVSWLHPTKTRTLTVLGENGMYVANYITQELFFYRQNENLFNSNLSRPFSITRADVVKIAFQAKEPLQIELEAFVEAITSNTKVPVTAEEGLMALKVALGMIASGKSHKVFR